MLSVELIVAIIALVAVLVTVFFFGMRMGRLEKDVEAGAERMKEVIDIVKKMLDIMSELERRSSRK